MIGQVISIADNDRLPLAAMAAVTKHLSFGVTASTTYEPPFLLARKYSTLDHLTKGRIAWNVVTNYLESTARNIELKTQFPHDER
jgi:alkanesulfonate monooxygenase SsuD/methylene tetrahydromethanopterin reductase-like flavin-dependent oxidoreductase (luciferase family)